MISGKSCRCLSVCGLLGVLIVAVGLYLGLGGSSSSPPSPILPDIERWVYPEARKAKGAVASNGGPCAAVGLRILAKGGSAVDALIATMLCDGVACMQNMGLGGGFIGALYIKRLGKVVAINARESAPAAAHRDMYLKNNILSQEGGLSIAVPGEIRGYWEMYKNYGGPVSWADLFTDTITLCEEGVPVNRHLDRNIAYKKDFILKMPSLREMLLKENGELPVYGDKIKLPKLAKTLRIIAKEGPEALYNGSLTAGLVKDIKDNGGIITVEDMASYKALWEEPTTLELSSGETVHSTPLPGSGPILNMIMKLLDNELSKGVDDLDTTFKITEAFKFSYAIRTYLGDPYFVNNTEILSKIDDPDFIKSIKYKLNVSKTSNDPKYYGTDYLEEDHGTANIVVYAPNGDVVAATSTINTIFGSGIVSESTGIILNNEMDDFSTPGLVNYFGVSPSPANFIEPYKRPLSSMAPAIILNKNQEPILAVGGAGGTRITTATALTMIRNLWYNLTTIESVRKVRFHHQLLPMDWIYEPLFDQNVVEGMKQRGHKAIEGKTTDSCITAISINGDILGPSSDYRRAGNTSFFL